MKRLSFFILLFAAGCAEFPELDQTLTDADRAAPYPTLLPTEALIAEAVPQVTDPDPLAARVAALRARAAVLRRTLP